MTPEILTIVVGIAIGLVLFLVAVLILRARRRRREAAELQRRATTREAPAATSQLDDEQLVAALMAAKQPEPRAKEPELIPVPDVPAVESGRSPALPAQGPDRSVGPVVRSTQAAKLSGVVEAKDRIRILIVDDHKDTRENVSRLISFEPDMEVIGQAYDGRQGLEMAIEMRPQIVMMDINMPDMDGITATREMSVQAPYSQVIIMSVQFEREYMRRAMLAGARDYQTKPFSADDLISCIRRVYNATRPMVEQIELVEKARREPEFAIARTAANAALAVPIFVVYGPKGGTGTTAIAINLAAALQQENNNTILVDADLQMGDIPVDLNVVPKTNLSDLIGIGKPDTDHLAKVLLAHSSGVKLLMAPQKPEQSELITGNLMIQVIRNLKPAASAIVVDTATYLSDHNLALMEIADFVLLVITPDVVASKDAKTFLDLASGLDLPLERIALVINRATMPGAIPTKHIADALKVPTVYQIPDDPKLRVTGFKGVTIFQLDGASPGATAISEMAQTLLKRLTESAQAAQPVEA